VNSVALTEQFVLFVEEKGLMLIYTTVWKWSLERG
jgi:hypothetical protein